MIVSFLAAIDRNLVLGDEKGIPWHLPEDLKRFRRLTLGKPIVMGRTTFEHIGRPLDKRVNIVLSRRTDYRPEGVVVVGSIDEAVRQAGDVPEMVVIGGGEVFQAALPLVTRAYLTLVEGEFTGTAYFPSNLPMPPRFEWSVIHRESQPADDKNPYAHHYILAELVESAWSTGGSRPVIELFGECTKCNFAIDMFAPRGITGIELNDCELPLYPWISGYNGKTILRESPDRLFEWGMDSSDSDAMFASGYILEPADVAERKLRSLSRCLAAAGIPHRILLDDPDGNLYSTIEYDWARGFGS